MRSLEDRVEAPASDLRRLFLALSLTAWGPRVISYRPLPGGAVVQASMCVRDLMGPICTYINTVCPTCSADLEVAVVRFLTGRLEACRVGFVRNDWGITAVSGGVTSARTAIYGVDGSLVDPSISGVPVLAHRTGGVTVGPSGKLTSRFMKIGAQAPKPRRKPSP